jgi:N6-adenosine-specific RNA methylase IME4
MSMEEIRELPVSDLAADDAHLYLWVTNSFIGEGAGLFPAWGFRYNTVLTWVKPSIGCGHYFRSRTEHVLFGRRGRLPTLRNDQGNVIEAPRGRHSEKPEVFYELVERSSPGPYLDMFARRLRPGWTSWGNEVPPSSSGPTHAHDNTDPDDPFGG